MEKSKITKDGLEKKRNFIRYVIKVINKSRHCNDTKWMKNKMWASCRGKKVKNNRTKSHSSIVLLSEQNKHESFSVLMITRWSFYLDVFFSYPKINLLHYLTSNRVSKLNCVFCATASKHMIIIDISNKHPGHNHLHTDRCGFSLQMKFFLVSLSSLPKLSHCCVKTSKKSLFKLISFSRIIDFG